MGIVLWPWCPLSRRIPGLHGISGSWRGVFVGGLFHHVGHCIDGSVGLLCIAGMCGRVTNNSCIVLLGGGLGRLGQSSVCQMLLVIFG